MDKKDLLNTADQATLSLIDSTLIISNRQQAVPLKDLEEQLSINTSRLNQLIETIQYDFADEIKQQRFTFAVIENELIIQFTANFSYADLLRKYLFTSVNVQIFMYLLQHPKLNKVELLYQLNISEATYFKRLQHLNELLVEFRLELSNGVLVGSEMDIRYFYLNLGAIFDLKWPTAKDNQIVQEVKQLEQILQTNLSPSIAFNVYWLIQITHYRSQFADTSNYEQAEWIQKFVAPLPFFKTFKQNYFNQLSFVKQHDHHYDLEASLFFVLLWTVDPMPFATSGYWHQLETKELAQAPFVRSYLVTMQQVDDYFPKMIPTIREGVAHEIALICLKIFFTNGYLYRINNLERMQDATLSFTIEDPWTKQFANRLIATIDENHYLTLNPTNITLLTENFVSIVNNTHKALAGKIKIGLSSAQSKPLVNVFRRYIILGLSYFTNVEIELYSDTHQYDYVITNRPNWDTDKAPVSYVTNFGTPAEYHQLQWHLLKVYQQKYSTH